MKRTNTGLWVTSKQGELFDSEEFETREEAIEYGREKYIGSFYIGQMVKLEFNEDDFYIDDIESQLYYSLENEVGEVADDYNISNDDLIGLFKVMSEAGAKYINEHNLHPTCFAITNDECIDKGENENE